MDEAMGRRTVSGLLVTKGGSILVFREESPRHKATTCCTRLGCSSKLFPNKDRKMCQTLKETSAPQRSQVLRKSNRVSPQRSISCDRSSNSRNTTTTSTTDETDNRQRRRENAGCDLLARLKERVNASRKRSLSGGSSPNPSSPNTYRSGSLSSSRSISRSLCRPASRMRKDGGRVPEAVRTHSTREGSRSSRQDRSSNQDPSGRFLSRNLFRHRSGLQRGPISSWEDSSNDSNEYWRFDTDENEEAEDDYVFNDRHRGMRMDIDDMSYEELLALGEKIGTVSTGLSDDALSECLKRSLYVPTASSSHEDGDIKCIICQEEYFCGVEVAKMVCKHYYHITCIQQWLRQKNWCPICKSVASSASIS